MIYKNFTNFLKNRAIELVGLSLVFIVVLLAVSFFSYSPHDLTLIYEADAVSKTGNLLGVYGGVVADFLLQSLGLTSFLVLITILSWGISLIVKKEIKKIKLKIFYLFLYILLTCVLIYTTYNNSFWLIDNGNSGFVGHILYNKIINFLPFIKNEYAIFILVVLSTIFFALSSSFNFKFIFLINKRISEKNKNNQIKKNNAQSDELIDQVSIIEKTQQAFSFEKTNNLNEVSAKHDSLKNFKLPSLDLLEKVHPK